MRGSRLSTSVWILLLCLGIRLRGLWWLGRPARSCGRCWSRRICGWGSPRWPMMRSRRCAGADHSAHLEGCCDRGAGGTRGAGPAPQHPGRRVEAVHHAGLQQHLGKGVSGLLGVDVGGAGLAGSLRLHDVVLRDRERGRPAQGRDEQGAPGRSADPGRVAGRPGRVPARGALFRGEQGRVPAPSFRSCRRSRPGTG